MSGKVRVDWASVENVESQARDPPSQLPVAQQPHAWEHFALVFVLALVYLSFVFNFVFVFVFEDPSRVPVAQ